jgi:hypothetical protein
MGLIQAPIRARSVAPVSTTTAALVRTAIVGLTLATAAIHATLGGWLFMANATGYVVLAAGMVVPLRFLADRRWLVRAALGAFTAATIVAWFAFGARFPLAYVDKAIEAVLLGFLLIEVYRYDGGPMGVLRSGLDLLGDIARAARSVVGGRAHSA